MRILFQLFVVIVVLAVSVPSMANEEFRPVPGYCSSAPLQICGASYTAQPGTLGNIQTFKLPDILKSDNFAVQCVTDGHYAFYKIVGDTVSCASKTCPISLIKFCGDQFLVKTEQKVGDTVEVTVPPELLVSDFSTSPPTISARCQMNNGVPQYEVDDDHGLSCNAFLCRPTKIEICHSSVTLSETAELGAVLQAKTMDGQPVTVQCLGSQGAPHYVVTDNTCN